MHEQDAVTKMEMAWAGTWPVIGARERQASFSCGANPVATAADDSNQRSQFHAVERCGCCEPTEGDMPRATLAPGATVIAADDFGPIIRGQLGMVTGCSRRTWLPWRRTAYFCTFLGGIHVTVIRRQIKAHDHACSMRMLEDPLRFLHARDALRKRRNLSAGLRRPAR